MAIPSSIGRFNIVKELGEGSQGVVYLANDSHLERPVAIKMQRIRSSTSDDRHLGLIHEARTVSKLRHPNIVPIYEAGEYQGKTYFVMEYVEGTSLRDLMKKQGAFTPQQATLLISKILDGIAHFHKQGVIHGDLTPSNIQIDENNLPRIMDFGISGIMSLNSSPKKFPGGTPLYMSPEHFLQTPPVPQSDIFSLGLIFYEMLVSLPAFLADNFSGMMNKIVRQPAAPPSIQNKSVDPHLDRIVLKALEKKLEQRYASALDMKEDLDAYLKTEKKSAEIRPTVEKDNRSTVDFLLRRMRHNTDFPAFSKYMVEINQKLASSEKYLSASDLSNVILKDYALTNKLLKLVNSAFYGLSAGKVTTVTRAVVLLGFEQVRMAAASLLLFEHMQSKAEVVELKDAALSSFASGLFARKMAKSVNLETEEAFVCAMLHNLGNQLVIFYLPEEYKEIKRRMGQTGEKEQIASRSVLGVSYDELGMAVAAAWKFPEQIIYSMERLPQGEVDAAKSEKGILRGICNFSNEFCETISKTAGEEERKEALSAVANRFKKIVPSSQKQMENIVFFLKEEMEKNADVLNIDLKNNNFMRQLTLDPRSQDQGARIRDTKPVPPSEDQQTLLYDTETNLPPKRREIATDELSFSEEDEGPHGTLDEGGPLNVLIEGIQEITCVLVEDYEISNVMIMIVETMYRGFSFNRVIFSMMTPKREAMCSRFGLGKDIDSLIKSFRFKLTKSSDVFNQAVLQGKDFRISDSRTPEIQALIPEWYRKIINAPAFIIYPIVFEKKCLGIFYADKEEKGPPIPKNMLNYMKILRGQMILAITKGRR